MRCRQGDLAVIVRSVAGNEGKIVRCVKFVPDLVLCRPGNTLSPALPGWRVDPPMWSAHGTLSRHAFDYQLRPIRDNDGEDEILRVVGKPNVKEKDTCTG